MGIVKQMMIEEMDEEDERMRRKLDREAREAGFPDHESYEMFLRAMEKDD